MNPKDLDRHNRIQLHMDALANKVREKTRHVRAIRVELDKAEKERDEALAELQELTKI